MNVLQRFPTEMQEIEIRVKRIKNDPRDRRILALKYIEAESFVLVPRKIALSEDLNFCEKIVYSYLNFKKNLDCELPNNQELAEILGFAPNHISEAMINLIVRDYVEINSERRINWVKEFKDSVGYYIPYAVLCDKELTPSAKFFYGFLLFSCHQKAWCNPSMKNIKEGTGMSKANVYRIVSSLYQKKLLKKLSGNGGKYWVHVLNPLAQSLLSNSKNSPRLRQVQSEFETSLSPNLRLNQSQFETILKNTYKEEEKNKKNSFSPGGKNNIFDLFKYKKDLQNQEKKSDQERSSSTKKNKNLTFGKKKEKKGENPLSPFCGASGLDGEIVNGKGNDMAHFDPNYEENQKAKELARQKRKEKLMQSVVKGDGKKSNHSTEASEEKISTVKVFSENDIQRRRIIEAKEKLREEKAKAKAEFQAKKKERQEGQSLLDFQKTSKPKTLHKHLADRVRKAGMSPINNEARYVDFTFWQRWIQMLFENGIKEKQEAVIDYCFDNWGYFVAKNWKFKKLQTFDLTWFCQPDITGLLISEYQKVNSSGVLKKPSVVTTKNVF